MQQSMDLYACALREPGAWAEKRARLVASRASDAGAFDGYASVFGVVDSAGDMIMSGAFANSLQRRGASGVKMLWQHQASEPIGVWTKIVEDRRGLRVEGQLDLSVTRAREALSLMRSGAVDGLSIGFKTKRATLDKQSGLRKLFEVDLWEISIVTFPALAQARIESAKRREAMAPVTIDDLMMKLARLRAHRAAENFESKLRLFALSLERRYSPSQPRVPAGSREGGRWTSGGGGSGTPGNQTALNVDPNAASDANNQILPAQNRRVGPDLNATPAQLARESLSAERAAEAISRVREFDPEWWPTPVLTDPHDIESRIARNESDVREANARYTDLLRARIGDNNPPKDPLADLSSRRPVVSPSQSDVWPRAFDPTNLRHKLQKYLLDPDNPKNQGKADWFERALGFNQNNWEDLANQLYFDPLTADLKRETVWGERFNQWIRVTGVNGRVIDVEFVFQKDPSGNVTFITGLPSEK
jgi:HK97 family phage prohead protease